MKNIITIALSIVFVFGLITGISLLRDTREASGSTIIGGEYQSTTTRRMPTGTGITNLTVLKSEAGTLGSIIITGANTGVLTLYDGTSTVTNTLWPTTTLATFPASTAAGTYTIDAVARKGIIIEYSGTVATATITYR